MPMHIAYALSIVVVTKYKRPISDSFKNLDIAKQQCSTCLNMQKNNKNASMGDYDVNHRLLW